MKSKCCKNKIKGWRIEEKIDNYLHYDKVRNSMCEPARLLIEAKTYIQSLHKIIHLLNEASDKLIDEKWKWKEICISESMDKANLIEENNKLNQILEEKSSLINQLQIDNNVLSAIIKEYQETAEKSIILIEHLKPKRSKKLRKQINDMKKEGER